MKKFLVFVLLYLAASYNQQCSHHQTNSFDSNEYAQNSMEPYSYDIDQAEEEIKNF